MPVKTQVLEKGNYVYSPEVPENEAFVEYLNFADRLLSSWHRACEASKQSRLSPELEQRQEKLNRTMNSFVDLFGPAYSLVSVRQNPCFLPVSKFFTRYRPLREPFSILHCDLATPLHTLHSFQDYNALTRINAALNGDTPFLWGQSGSNNRPCFLFGDCVWELNDSETSQSDAGIALLFLEIADRHERSRLMG
jgi:hypothetical protein